MRMIHLRGMIASPVDEIEPIVNAQGSARTSKKSNHGQAHKKLSRSHKCHQTNAWSNCKRDILQKTMGLKLPNMAFTHATYRSSSLAWLNWLLESSWCATYINMTKKKHSTPAVQELPRPFAIPIQSTQIPTSQERCEAHVPQHEHVATQS